MDRRGFLQRFCGMAAGVAVLSTGVTPAAALMPAAPLPPLDPVKAPAAAVLRDSDLEDAALEEARYMYRRRYRRRRMMYRRPRRFYRMRRRRRMFY